MYTLKMLDCFCGMGGVSDGFAAEGFDVTGIDLVNAPEMLGYKHKFIQASMKDLKGSDFRGFDVIWGSPPCREFSEFCRIYGSTWKNPPDPKRGLELVHSFLKFVEEAQPRFWMMENVAGLTKYHKEKPHTVTYLTVGSNGMGKKHAFWGNFPLTLIPKDTSHIITYHKVINGKRYPKSVSKSKRSAWENVKIPLTCSRAFAKTCKEALTSSLTGVTKAEPIFFEPPRGLACNSQENP
jgi:DNA (cytosine-5)-methyltransferase 1